MAMDLLSQKQIDGWLKKDSNGHYTRRMKCDGGGLWLSVTPTGASWLFRYTAHGERKQMGLGSLATVTLKQARKLATDHRTALAAGEDPKVGTNRQAQRGGTARHVRLVR